jgi:long-chain fatty acid transport protein
MQRVIKAPYRCASLLGAFFAPLLPHAAWAGGGASVVEQGTPRNGVASAGSAAFADDASISFFNPAGMARLRRSQFMIGAQIVRQTTEFDPSSEADVFMGGDDGGNAGGYAPGASNYYVHTFGERWRGGISLTAPAAGGLDYGGDFLGRYYVYDVSMLALNLNPAVSYKVNDWLSVGGGGNLAYMTMDYKLKLPNVASIVVPTAVRSRLQEAADRTDFPPAKRFLEDAANNVPDPMPMPDAKLKLDDLDDWAGGWNLGVLVEPRQGTRIGLAYRSELEFDLEGSFDTDGVGPLMTALGLTSGDAGSKFKIPQIVVGSLYHQVTEPLAILVDVMWTDWSVFEYTPIELGTTAGAALNIPRDWKDTWRYAVGLEYQLTPRWMLQTGFSYDTTPIRGGDKGLPDLPVTRIYKIAAGLKYTWSENTTLGLTYMYADLGSSPVDFTTITGRVKGNYSSNYMHILGFSINWKHGD